jgi:hypothetical protein
VGLLLTGCFYVDPINRAPIIKGIECFSMSKDRSCGDTTGIADGYFQRGETLRLKANITDQDSQPSTAQFGWSALRCAPGDGEDCRDEITDSALHDSEGDTTLLTVPTDLEAGVLEILVVVVVHDDRGAFASGGLSLNINDPPTLTLAKSPPDNVVFAPITVFATYGDNDDGPSHVNLTWEVQRPTGAAPDFEILEIPPSSADPAHTTEGRTLVPTVPGAWAVTVTAKDALEAQVTMIQSVTVGPDEPPCIVRVAPLVPPDDASLPVTEPTVFQVPLVKDALDPYPPLPDPHFGTTAFQWQIRLPGASAWQSAGTSNSVDFDPRGFTPGDIVELRVEVFDRSHTAKFPCADDVATCSLTQDDCIQRQTWRVEAR